MDILNPLPDAGGGLPAFACRDTRASGPALMALRVQPHRPPRADALEGLIGQSNPGVLLPLAHGAAADAYYVVCPAPTGTALGSPLGAPRQAWGERELVDLFIRPVAQALLGLAERGITHRAINLGNLFQAGPRTQVVLGTAWAAPPASLQPAIYEPPYIAMCLPTGRGTSSVADDVYAIGVVMLALATGRQPMAGMDDAAMLHHKLDVGSFQALVGNSRPAAFVADLARGMLAEDPDHRPTLEMLIDPAVARTRRVAARPPRRAARPLDIGKISVANARGLAWVLARDAPVGIATLRDGQAEQWLRRSLNDVTLASAIKDATRQRANQEETNPRADAILLARAVAVLDPQAPVCWHGVSLWPDGIGTALAGAQDNPRITATLADLIDSEFIGHWAAIHTGRIESTGDESATNAEEDYLRREAHRIRTIADGSGRRSQSEPSRDGIIRLRYLLNPLLPCSSALLNGHWVADLPALLPALEAAAAHADVARNMPYDAEIAAFIAARTNRRDERDATAKFPAGEPNTRARTQTWLYANLQSRLHPTLAFPNIAGWLIAQSAPMLAEWEHRPRRQAIRQHLEEHAQSGQLVPLLAVLEDPETRITDQRGAADAIATVSQIDASLHSIAHGGMARAELARRMGQELAAGAGLAGLAGVLTALALG